MSNNPENSNTNIQTEIGRVEANLAFFSARFALIQHQPDTAYKRAQLKAYESLQAQLQSQLEQLHTRQKLNQNKTRSPA